MKTGTRAYQILFPENSLIESLNYSRKTQLLVIFRGNGYFSGGFGILIRIKSHDIQLLFRFYSHVLFRPLLSESTE